MSNTSVGRATVDGSLSIARGIPLADEPGLGPLTLPAYLREVTRRYGPREALVFHHPDGRVERWTYDELWERAMAVAQALVASGVSKQSRVGVMMTNRPEWLASVFGVGLAGGVAVTLSTFSTPAELEYLLQASGVGVLLFEGQVLKKDFAADLRSLEPEIAEAAPGELASLRFPYLHRLVVLGEGHGGAIESWETFLARGANIARELIQARGDAVTPADPGLVLFSSGSTGKPKGVVSAHRAVAIQCWRFRRMFALEDNVRCWSANGFFWSGNFAMALGATLTSGGSLVLQPTFEPAEALRLMQLEKVTNTRAWPHQWAQLRALPEWEEADLSSLHYVDPTYTAGQKTVQTTWGDPRWAYGNTETFTFVCAFPSGTPEEIAGESHGEPLPGATIKIVDPLTGRTLPLRERGELAVKGPTLMLGYLGVPADETLDQDGFFRTGDSGWIDEKGRLYWQGRLNDIIKTGGANVSPLEVDEVLATCPGVKLHLTVGLPHEMLGEMVVACIVPKAGAQLGEATVRDFLKERLASYKVPRRVFMIREDELALTSSAKLKSDAVRALAIKRLEVERAAER